jgi:hypothetical protein
MFGVMYFLWACFGVVIFEGKINTAQRVGFAGISLPFLLLGIGILWLKEWARLLIIFLSGGLFLILIVPWNQHAIKQSFTIVDGIFYLALLLPVIYFTRPKVIGQFKKIEKR